MKNTLFNITLSAAIIAAMSACGCKTSKGADMDVSAEDSMAYSIYNKEKGDSTLYGLACDGCTDSVVVFLPYEGGDPVRYEIIDARHNGRVYGRPKIGDRLAININPMDKDEALQVIDLEDLKGSWCNTFMPKFRDLDKMPKRLQRRMMTDMPDSIKQKFLVPKEFGFEIKGTNTVLPIGMIMRVETSDDMSPVEYPKQKIYKEWRIYNGQLLHHFTHILLSKLLIHDVTVMVRVVLLDLSCFIRLVLVKPSLVDSNESIIISQPFWLDVFESWQIRSMVRTPTRVISYLPTYI